MNGNSVKRRKKKGGKGFFYLLIYPEAGSNLNHQLSTEMKKCLVLI